MEEVDHLVARADVQARGGLVQQDQLRLPQQRPGDERRLLLPAGKLPDLPLPQLQQVQPLQDLVRAVTFLGAGAAEPAPLPGQPQQHHLLHRDGKAQVDLFQLRHVAHGAEGGAVGRRPVDHHPPLPGPDVPQDGAQERRLAAAVGSHDRQELRRPELQVHVGDSQRLPVAAGHVHQFHDGPPLLAPLTPLRAPVPMQPAVDVMDPVGVLFGGHGFTACLCLRLRRAPIISCTAASDSRTGSCAWTPRRRPRGRRRREGRRRTRRAGARGGSRRATRAFRRRGVG